MPHVFFQKHNISVDDHDLQLMMRRIEGLAKFFGSEAQVYVDLECMRPSQQHGDDLYRASLRIEEASLHYFTEDFQEHIKKAFDHAYRDMYRMVRNDRSRSRRLARKAGKHIKGILKRLRKET